VSCDHVRPLSRSAIQALRGLPASFSVRVGQAFVARVKESSSARRWSSSTASAKQDPDQRPSLSGHPSKISKGTPSLLIDPLTGGCRFQRGTEHHLANRSALRTGDVAVGSDRLTIALGAAAQGRSCQEARYMKAFHCESPRHQPDGPTGCCSPKLIQQTLHRPIGNRDESRRVRMMAHRRHYYFLKPRAGAARRLLLKARRSSACGLRGSRQHSQKQSKALGRSWRLVKRRRDQAISTDASDTSARRATFLPGLLWPSLVGAQAEAFTVGEGPGH